MSDHSPAIDVAKAKELGDIITLSTGYRARIVPVAAVLIEEVTSRIEDPVVPKWFDDNKQREQPNPLDPDYVRQLGIASRKRGEAAIDALVMFGVELVDGLPPEDEWLSKLQMMEKRGLLSLAGYDLNDTMEREFLFKRFIAVGSPDLEKISRAAGVTEAAVARAAAQFPGS